MTFREIDIGGVYIAPFAMMCLMALPPFLITRLLLGRLGLLRRLWHPALFELALYTVMVGALADVF